MLAVLVACSRAPSTTPGTPEDLAAYLADIKDPQREVASWLLDDASWQRTIVEPFRGLYTDYARGFDAATAPLAAQLAHAGKITARRHYAGDARLTMSQARLRWMLPVMYPSAVAELDGVPIDTVFVFDGTHWRVLAGLDALQLARARAIDPGCGALLAKAGPTGRCTEIGYVVAAAAMKDDRERFAHACAMAATLCGKPSP